MLSTADLIIIVLALVPFGLLTFAKLVVAVYHLPT